MHLKETKACLCVLTIKHKKIGPFSLIFAIFFTYKVTGMFQYNCIYLQIHIFVR